MAKQPKNIAIGHRFYELLKAQPFRPFIVTTIAGDKYRVPRADYGIVSPARTDVYFYETVERGHFLSTDYIVSIEPVPKRKKKKRGRS